MRGKDAGEQQHSRTRLALATFSRTLGLLPLLLQVPHYSGGGGDGGVRGQGGHTGGHSGRDLLGPEAPSDEFEVDHLASVPEHLHRLLIGVSLDINTVNLQCVGGGGGLKKPNQPERYADIQSTHSYYLVSDVDASIVVHGAVFRYALDKNARGL